MMMSISNDLPYQIALTLVPQVGVVHARILAESFATARDIFQCPASQLEKIEGIGAARARAIRKFNNFSRVEKEIRFIEKYRIRPLFITAGDYPYRLLHCYDPPTMLYFKGAAQLNGSKSLAIVGTRNHTGYGKQVTETLVKEIASIDPYIISGLAFGIDTLAHRAAIRHHLSTIAVLAHGLDTIYPPENHSLARTIVEKGGLLTEFMSGTAPDKHNFPSRNRIVAGLADATVLIETGVKGGSMITADLALNYNREVFAVPGKITDPKSQGCNQLIQQNKASLFSSASHMAEYLGWKDIQPKPGAEKLVQVQAAFYQDLSSRQQKLVECLKEKNSMHIDELQYKSGLSPALLSSELLSLEMMNLIVSLPGKRYRIELQPF